MRSLILVITLSLSLAAAATTVYQWTDPQGNTHFSSAPGNQSAEPLELENEAPKNPTLEEREQARQERGQKAREEEQQQAREEAEAKELAEADSKRKEVCAQYAKNLKLLQETGRRVYTVDPKGKTHYFSDAERQQEIQELQRDIQRHCP